MRAIGLGALGIGLAGLVFAACIGDFEANRGMADADADPTSPPDTGDTGRKGELDGDIADSADAADGGPREFPSCLAGGPGLTNCGTGTESCCTSLPVTGGTYNRTYSYDGGLSGLADPATVSNFRLDKYEATVGRFRQFVAAWKGGWSPAAGSGKHTHLNGDQGLENSGNPGTYENGWNTSDNTNIAPTDANLACNAIATWTPSVGSQEKLPINCVNWWEASAFCIWDGGFLPSEAEWEYAAAGGNQQRKYPWGATDPGTASAYAIYDCAYPYSTAFGCTGTITVANIAPVGTAASGAGLWGQLDLAGNVGEWTLDWYADAYVTPCTNCAALARAYTQVFRGGTFSALASDLAPPDRRYSGVVPTTRGRFLGLRCARTP
jgi:formylglycine-generating enzyme required for sulfatase activity